MSRLPTYWNIKSNFEYRHEFYRDLKHLRTRARKEKQVREKYISDFIEKHFSSEQQTQIQNLTKYIKDYFLDFTEELLVVLEEHTSQSYEDLNYDYDCWYKILLDNPQKYIDFLQNFDNLYKHIIKDKTYVGNKNKGFEFLRKFSFACHGELGISTYDDDLLYPSKRGIDSHESEALTMDMEEIGFTNVSGEFNHFCKLKAIEMISRSSKLEKEIENLKKQIAIHSPIFCEKPEDFELVQKLMNTVSYTDMIKLLTKKNSPLANKLIRTIKKLIEKGTKQALENLEKQRETILKQEEKQLQLLESLKKKRKTNLAAIQEQNTRKK